MDNIRTLVHEHTPFLIEARRELHRIPELAFEEVKTAAYVAKALEDMGLSVRTGVAGTGVVALLETGRPGPVVMLRADMDALPMTEATGLDFCSLHEGCMHACGHDTHMAILLTAAKVLTAMRDELRGTVKFVFQPAEEFPGGARPMIDEGVLYNPKVNHCFGLHVWPGAPSGVIEVKSGPLMAAMDRFEVTIIGKGGHAAKPHECVDALEIGTQAVGALQRIISRKIDPVHPALLTVAVFNAGHAFNVIAETATFGGTLRTFDRTIRSQWEERIRQVLGGICDAMGATYEFTFIDGYPPLHNNPAMADVIRRAASDAVGKENVHEATPTMGGEDMAYFLEQVPGCFFFLGTGYEGCHTIHNPAFTVDENALPAGVETFCRAVRELLGTA
ncbi:M20 family metallopeptidase [Desulfovibrio mangrovi]|uniref:M20 metallopeptidase family protein n=1 Tax=Desulfovibrio mangrovi TaxID=2976983 RepID=UPI00224708B9|nr:M20 family metallopeptidase [Desulfovibrio mangrovi]UZP69007.1 M20 family metallopeptidase [Desulfovibrio mangrovi]